MRATMIIELAAVYVAHIRVEVHPRIGVNRM